LNLSGTSEGVVARVAGEPITVHQVADRLTAIRRGPLAPLLPHAGPEDRRSRRWVLRLLVSEAIVAYHAGFTARSSSDSEDLSANGVDAVGAAALADAAQRLFDQITSKICVSEEEVHGYYARNLDQYHLPARRLLHHRSEQDLEVAQLVAGRMANGDAAGSRFEIRRGEFGGPFEAAVFAAQVGEVIGPIESELGWQVAIVEAVFESSYVPFERVRSDIESDLLSVARGRAFDQWMEQQRRALAIVMPGWGHPGDPSLPDFSHRH
jgi:[acyl-carrier-protein] S-malonyltransferase